MRNPNGYGTVAKLSGNRRNPFVVRKTIGWDDRGYPMYDTIGYAPTREAGMIILAQYNNDPWNLDKEKTTFIELLKLWEEKKLPKLGKSNQSCLRSASKNCEQIYKLKYKAVRAYHMQDIIDNCGKSYATQAAIKALFGHLDKFALELDIINKCYSDLLTSESIPDTSKIPFTDDEVDRLWRIERQEWVDSVLVFLYSGFRISELLGIKTANVHLEEGIIKGGTKSKAGKDRVVPIHSKILKFIEARVNEGNEYLFSYNGKHCSKLQYYKIWNTIMEQLGFEHTPHECRHTFRSRLDSAGANKVCMNLIMGHKSKEVGERVYTHKTIQELKSAIELITH